MCFKNFLKKVFVIDICKTSDEFKLDGKEPIIVEDFHVKHQDTFLVEWPRIPLEREVDHAI